jgi:pimeloyl-ACP methyl ester carboxylesterase
MQVAQWDYQQDLDEPACIEVPLRLLHEYLQEQGHPVHLAGHGISGALALLYAQRYPDRVRSLVLLGVSPCPAVCWQSYYYSNRWMLNCDRTFVLSMMVSQLFGEAVRSITRELVCRLKRELDETPSPHSLFRKGDLPITDASVPVPLLVCGSQNDVVIPPETLTAWQSLLKPERGDSLWQCPSGRHFFHYFQPKQVSQVMAQFWQQPLSELAQSTLNICTPSGRSGH